MAELRQFLERFSGSGDAEILWLQQLFVFVRDHLSPGQPQDESAPASPTASVSELSVDLVRILQENSTSRSLPVSYRLVSVSDLVSLQRVPCVSNLSWTTNQHRAWAREAELTPGLRPLPRVNLLLIGRLWRGRGQDLRLRDSSGEITCQTESQVSGSSLSPDRAVFLPHWNYIPHTAPGQGLLELIGPPLPLCPGPEQGLADATEGAGLRAALSVSQVAALLLQHKNRGRGSGSGRGLRGGRVSVKGVVSAVCPLLDICGTTFFVFSLTQNDKTVNVIVKDSSSRLWWSRSVHVGQSAHVTELRACTLRSWRGNSVLSATDQSDLSVCWDDQSQLSVRDDQSQLSVQDDQSQLSVQDDQSQLSVQDDQSQLSVRDNQSQLSVQDDQSQLSVQLGSEETQTQDQSEAEAVSMDQSGLRRSSVISYRGTVTEVLSRGAGLYVIDRKVGLCLANQPLPTRAIRPGDRIQLFNVHLLLKPSPDHTPIMLCCCLRSSVTVTAFSPGCRVGDKGDGCPGDGVLLQLLLQKNVGVAEYLWMCHVTRRLRDSLFSQRQQCLCLLSWKILESLSPKPRKTLRRDIYREMMDLPHTCSLTQYSSGASVPQVLSLSELRSWLLSLCWSSLKLSSLLPPDGQSLNCSQLNAALSWSRLCLRSDLRDFKDLDLDQGDQRDLRIGARPLLLVALVELPSETSEFQSLQLRDGTGTIPCVVTEPGPDQDQNQTVAFNTAWIGCLVCVRHFTMVTERFIQSQFPSFKHLDQEQFISSKDCRVYLQFSLDQVSVLSPSVSMANHLRQEAGPGSDVINEEQEKEAESEESERKRRRREDGEAGGGARACVSVVIQVEQKEGVAWRNVGAGPTLAFTLRAAAIGPVVGWGRDPKNRPITEREVKEGDQKMLSLSFSGPSSRWFPLLQNGLFYRLVALDSEDPSVLIGCAVAGQRGVELHADPALQVCPDWRIHSVPRPQTGTAGSCDLSSLSDVINSRSDLVSFQGLVLDRVGVTDRSQDSAHTGVRLTVCDLSGRSLQVYLDLSHSPFVPGLLPGNTVKFSRVQRKVSRSGSVYCSSIPVSCVSVVSVGQSSAPTPPPFPMMLLGDWAKEGGVSVARVRGHVVCVLFAQLQWSCSRCERVFYTSCSGSQCSSTSAVFQAKAKAVVEDGSAEAQVWFYSPQVQTLLRLDDSQWAGLQRALRVKGYIQVQPRGRNLSVTRSDPDSDPLLSFLLCCVGEAQVGSVSLTCRRQRSARATELRRMVRGDRDFVTRVTPPLQLTCVHLERH